VAAAVHVRGAQLLRKQLLLQPHPTYAASQTVSHVCGMTHGVIKCRTTSACTANESPTRIICVEQHLTPIHADSLGGPHAPLAAHRHLNL
jgi:hypothetical protein